MGGHGEGSGASDASLASSLGAQLTCWFWAREQAGGPQAEARVRSSLTPPHGRAPLLADHPFHPAPWLPDKRSPVGGAHSSTDQWLSGTRCQVTGHRVVLPSNGYMLRLLSLYSVIVALSKCY